MNKIMLLSLGLLLLPVIILFVDYISDKLYFYRFYTKNKEKYKQLLEIMGGGEIKESKLLFSLTDKYNKVSDMLNNAKTFDDIYKFLENLESLKNECIDIYYEKIEELNDEERKECIKCHQKYLNLFEEYEKSMNNRKDENYV